MKKFVLLGGVACLFAANAQALELSPYIGADYNYTMTHHAKSDAGLLPSKYHTGTFAFGTYVGRYAALEGFAEFSKYEDKKGNRLNYRAFGADLLGVLPFGCHDQFKLLGSVGAGRYYNKARLTTVAGKETVDEYDWGYRFGAGAQYDINENWAIRTMYHHVVFNKPHFAYTNLDAFSVGVRYNF
ncbi:MAG: porin family protein [Alphaproteobacteria bacterium]|nr:porin family protein [Alphaproteobacteria bacterium]